MFFIRIKVMKDAVDIEDYLEKIFFFEYYKKWINSATAALSKCMSFNSKVSSEWNQKNNSKHFHTSFIEFAYIKQTFDRISNNHLFDWNKHFSKHDITFKSENKPQ